MQLDAQRLLVLRAVWRTGSAQAAARALHLTPSGVSQHVSRLEAQTGLRLVDRSQRGGGRVIRLTPAGIALAERAERIAVALGEAEREADRLAGSGEDVVRVGGFATLLSELAAPVIASLAISQPGFEVAVVEVERQRGTELLRADEIDLLLTEAEPGAEVDPPLTEDYLLRDTYRIVVPRHASEADLPALLAERWVTAPETHQTRQILEVLCAEHGVAPLVRHVCVESRTRLALVAAGLGAALVSDLTMSAYPTTGVNIFASAADVGSRAITVMHRDIDDDRPATGVFLRELQRAVSATSAKVANV